MARAVDILWSGGVAIQPVPVADTLSDLLDISRHGPPGVPTTRIGVVVSALGAGLFTYTVTLRMLVTYTSAQQAYVSNSDGSIREWAIAVTPAVASSLHVLLEAEVPTGASGFRLSARAAGASQASSQLGATFIHFTAG